ncbi:MAG: sulfatase-like hydrolase/transferase [Muribaculaceae bacterium]
MKLRNFVFAAFVIGVALFSRARAQEQRNVLFILVDDMQRDAIGYLGNHHIQTPNIDRLMRSGVTFTNAYTNGALCGALSMPSRAMIMTGRGMFQVQSDGSKIPECHTTLPQHLRANGYRTFATGKWHSDKASFNRSFAEGENIFFGGMHTYEHNGHVSPHLTHYDASGKYGKDKAFVGDKFSSEMFADAAVDFLQSTKGSTQPFMAYVAFTSPHDPRNQHPIGYGRTYTAQDVALPKNFLPEHPFDNGELKVRDELLLPTPRSGEDMKKEIALYYNMVNEVDCQIGRVIDALKQSGNYDNTIIVFASDNGLAMGQNGLIGKQSLYEHSVGVPLAIIDPANRQNRGEKSQALCYLYDVYPTLCRMLGISVPQSVTGHSLDACLKRTDMPHRQQIMLGYANQQRALVRDGYKYIIYNVEGVIHEQLFDLKADPGELNNLAEQNQQKVSQYRQWLAQSMRTAGDFCNLDNPLWWSDGHKITWNELINLYIFDR